MNNWAWLKAKKAIKVCVLSVVCVWLSACSTHSIKPSVDQYPALKQQWLQHQAQLKAIQHWGITGKASITSEQGNGTVSLFWTHANQNNTLKIVAPFGRGTLNIQSDGAQAYMIDPQGRRHSAATMKGLVWLKTGFEIPFDALQQWMLGIAPDPDSPSLLITPQGQTMGFIHDGWAVRYVDFVEHAHRGQVQSLPRKIYLTNPNIDETFSVKLAVRAWDLSAVPKK